MKSIGYVAADTANLLVLNGSLCGNRVRFLIDSGASNSYLNTDLCGQLGLLTVQKVAEDTVRLANGQTQNSSAYLPNARIHIGTYKDKESFHITPLRGFDAILGRTWLKRINPQIDWKSGRMGFQYDGKYHRLSTPGRETRVTGQCHHLLLGIAELRTVLKEKAAMVICAVKGVEQLSKTAIRALDMSGLLEKYKDVFSPLQSLPPLRSVNHEIVLEPGKQPHTEEFTGCLNQSCKS